jgi:hypothetical protein
VTLDFLAGGGDNIFQKITEFATLDTQDFVLTSYIEKNSPVTAQIEGRLKAVDTKPNGTETVDGTPSTSPTTSPSPTKTPNGGARMVEKGSWLALAALIVVGVGML